MLTGTHLLIPSTALSCWKVFICCNLASLSAALSAFSCYPFMLTSTHLMYLLAVVSTANRSGWPFSSAVIWRLLKPDNRRRLRPLNGYWHRIGRTISHGVAIDTESASGRGHLGVTWSRTHTALEVMTGTCWIDDTNVQKFCMHFLSKLKAARTALLFPDLF